jgi:hypothetical protein
MDRKRKDVACLAIPSRKRWLEKARDAICLVFAVVIVVVVIVIEKKQKSSPTQNYCDGSSSEGMYRLSNSPTEIFVEVSNRSRNCHAP